jgi:hypothetical protein
MRRPTEPRSVRRARRQARAALAFCVVVWLVFCIVYTPIHLCLEPHSDGENPSTGTASAHSGDCVADERHDAGDHHERHSAEQHKFKVTQATRAIVADLIAVQLMEWVNPDEGCPQPQAVEFSGLSPPEFHCCWQFIFRTALPVRAPSLLS